MNFDGIDADSRSSVSESDYQAAYTYAQYDVRGEASADETEWLASHPILWLLALRALKAEAWKLLERDNTYLRTHPDKPGPRESGPESTRKHQRWHQIRKQHKESVARRKHYIAKVVERMYVARGLLPSDPMDEWRISLTLSVLADIDTLIRQDANDDASDKVRYLMSRLAEVRDAADGAS